MNIAVCDDTFFFRNHLSQIISEYSADKNLKFDISCFSNGTDLLKSDKNFDLIFLDYMMQQHNGMDVIKHIREYNSDVKVVFVTSYPQIVFDSIKYKPFRFILKPIEPTKITEALDAAIREIKNNDVFFVIKNADNNNIVIPENHIVYIQADNNCSIVVTENDTYRMHDNISEIEHLLQNDCFFRTHRSFIVNVRYVKAFNNKEVVFLNNQKAAVSRLRYMEFKNFFYSYMKRVNPI